MNRRFIEVTTGQVTIKRRDGILRSSPLGSCIAVMVYDPSQHVGGLAHIMLPGQAPETTPAMHKTRYAEPALAELIAYFKRIGCSNRELIVVIVGGGNVLKHPNDTICEQNIRSVLQCLEKLDLHPTADCLGGHERRIAHLDLHQGQMTCVQGDAPPISLWPKRDN